MHSLSELKTFFTNHEITVKEYNGFSLIVGKDTWTMAHGVYYRNNIPAKPKDEELIASYKKLKSKKTSKSKKST